MVIKQIAHGGQLKAFAADHCIDRSQICISQVSNKQGDINDVFKA
jgi:hypothetical protein